MRRLDYGAGTLDSVFRPLLICAAAAVLEAVLCVALRPLLLRYALARPNARSSHKIPTPQGGGIAVLAGAFLALGTTLWLVPLEGEATRAVLVLALAVIGLGIVGAWDDIRPLPAGIRLVLARTMYDWEGAKIVHVRPTGANTYDVKDVLPLPYVHRFDLLPVNGRRPELSQNGVPGNFDLDEAIALAGAVDASAMIAHHYGLFDFNTAAPEEIDAAARSSLSPLVHRAREAIAFEWAGL